MPFLTALTGTTPPSLLLKTTRKTAPITSMPIDLLRSCISKYAPRAPQPFVDHQFYTTVSMIHTMEVAARPPAMNLFDAHAPLMAPLLSGPGTQPPYQVDDKNLRSGLIYNVNEKKAAGAKESSLMDFSRPDATDAR